VDKTELTLSSGEKVRVEPFPQQTRRKDRLKAYGVPNQGLTLGKLNEIAKQLYPDTPTENINCVIGEFLIILAP